MIRISARGLCRRCLATSARTCKEEVVQQYRPCANECDGRGGTKTRARRRMPLDGGTDQREVLSWNKGFGMRARLRFGRGATPTSMPRCNQELFHAAGLCNRERGLRVGRAVTRCGPAASRTKPVTLSNQNTYVPASRVLRMQEHLQREHTRHTHRETHPPTALATSPPSPLV